MPAIKRPRVAAIGLTDSQLESISHLCGVLRAADSPEQYAERFSWPETDVAVCHTLKSNLIEGTTHLLAAGFTSMQWQGPIRFGRRQNYVLTDTKNTDLELTVSESCPERYRLLAAELSKRLSGGDNPSAVLHTSLTDKTSVVETTSGKFVALRLDLQRRVREDGSTLDGPIGLFLPEVPNLSAWFHAFLCDLHEIDSERVPLAPPKLIDSSAWYGPEERALATQIERTNLEIERLREKRKQLRIGVGLSGRTGRQGNTTGDQGGRRRTGWGRHRDSG